KSEPHAPLPKLRPRRARLPRTTPKIRPRTPQPPSLVRPSPTHPRRGLGTLHRRRPRLGLRRPRQIPHAADPALGTPPQRILPQRTRPRLRPPTAHHPPDVLARGPAALHLPHPVPRFPRLRPGRPTRAPLRRPIRQAAGLDRPRPPGFRRRAGAPPALSAAHRVRRSIPSPASLHGPRMGHAGSRGVARQPAARALDHGRGGHREG